MSANSAMSKTDLAIITVLEEEYAAVIRVFDRHDSPAAESNPNRYAWRLGEVQTRAYQEPYRVVLAMLARPGTEQGTVGVAETIERWQPRYVVLCGIAGGLPKRGVALGDVVIAEAVWGYLYGKVVDNSIEPRIDKLHSCDDSLLTSAASLPLVCSNWAAELSLRPPSGPESGSVSPKVHRGPVASGNWVVDDAGHAAVRRVLDKCPKLMAFEMEGLGGATAVKSANEGGSPVGFLMVRGISDLVCESGTEERQSTTRDEWKAYASTTAATFVGTWIRQCWPVGPVASQPGPPAATGQIPVEVHNDTALLTWSGTVRSSATVNELIGCVLTEAEAQRPGTRIREAGNTYWLELEHKRGGPRFRRRVRVADMPRVAGEPLRLVLCWQPPPHRG